MKQSIAYEWKRILMPLCIFTAIATAVFAVSALTTKFVRLDLDGERAVNNLVFLPAAILVLLCYLVPAMQFSFRMKRRSVDLWYSLPIAREKLIFVRWLGGLTLILIPYTVSFFVGVAVIACSHHLFQMQYYFALYFASLPLAVLFFGVNCFLFTRANTVFDGVVFMLTGSLLISVPVIFVQTWLQYAGIYHLPYSLPDLTYTATFGPLTHTFDAFGSAILGNGLSVKHAWILYTLASVEGAAAYFGLFFRAKAQRAENAEQISDSPFGYAGLIPYYCFFVTASIAPISFLRLSGSHFVGYLAVIVISFCAYFIYRRSFRLKKKDCICLSASFLGGIAVMILLSLLI